MPLLPQEYNWRPRSWAPLVGKNENILSHTPLFGIEIETEYTRQGNLTALMKEHESEFLGILSDPLTYRNVGRAIYPLQSMRKQITDLKFYIKRDGSLKEGFEVVTPPFTLRWLAEHIGDLAALLRKMTSLGFNSYDTGTCGMHVHISRASFLSPLHQWRFWLFFMQNYDFFHVLSKRDHTSSAKYAGYYATPLQNLKTRITTVPKQAHHEAVEMTHENSIEVRIFRGTLNHKTIINEILLVNAIREYTGQASAANQSINGFMQWLSTYTIPTPEEVGGKDYCILYDQKENLETIKATVNKVAKTNKNELVKVISYGAPVVTKFNTAIHIKKANERYGSAEENIKELALSCIEKSQIKITEPYDSFYVWNPNQIILPSCFWTRRIMSNMLGKQIQHVVINPSNAELWWLKTSRTTKDIPRKSSPYLRLHFHFFGGTKQTENTIEYYEDGLKFNWDPATYAAYVDAARNGVASGFFFYRAIEKTRDGTENLLADHTSQIFSEAYQSWWHKSRLTWKPLSGYWPEEYSIVLQQNSYRINYSHLLQHQCEPRIAVTDQPKILYIKKPRKDPR